MRRRPLLIAALAAAIPLLCSTSAAAAVLKPPVQGTIDRSGPPAAGYADNPIDAYVVAVGWSQLESTEGTIDLNNPIDQAISYISQNHPGWHLKVRLQAGDQTPSWLVTRAGTVVIYDNQQMPPAPHTIGDFWKTSYGNAYHAFIGLLATKYDANPFVRDFTIARCMTVYDEPLVRQASYAQNRTNLLTAGWTDTSDKHCQSAEIADHSQFAQTRSSLSFNPYDDITGTPSNNTYTTDEAYTQTLMDQCRSTGTSGLGHRCILENNSLRDSFTDTSCGSKDWMCQLYAHMKSLGGPIAVQTATSGRVGDLNTTLNLALDIGANNVEIPGGYASLCTSNPEYCQSNLATFDRQLEAKPY